MRIDLSLAGKFEINSSESLKKFEKNLSFCPNNQANNPTRKPVVILLKMWYNKNDSDPFPLLFPLFLKDISLNLFLFCKSLNYKYKTTVPFFIKYLIFGFFKVLYSKFYYFYYGGTLERTGFNS